MRNPSCPLYSDYLTVAAHQNLEWSCTGCPYQHRTDGDWELFHEGYRKLIAAVLHPSEFRKAETECQQMEEAIEAAFGDKLATETHMA